MDFFKYLTVREDDEDWGIYLNVAGKAHISPQTAYPPGEHPSGYFFNWVVGRVLQEYQLIYITEGKGGNSYGSLRLAGVVLDKNLSFTI